MSKCMKCSKGRMHKMVVPVIVIVALSCLCRLTSGSAHSGEAHFMGGQQTVQTQSDEDVEVSVSGFDSTETQVDVGECQCQTVKPAEAEDTIGHVKINMKDGVTCTNVEPVDVIEECKGYCYSKDKPGPFGKYDAGITLCHFCGRVQTYVDVMMKCKKKKYRGYQRKEYYETYRQLFKNVPLDTGCKCQDCQPEHGYSSMGSAAPVDYAKDEYEPGMEQDYEPAYGREYQPEYQREPQYQSREREYQPKYESEEEPKYGEETPEYKPKDYSEVQRKTYEVKAPEYGASKEQYGGYKKPYGEKEKCKKLVLESKYTYAQFTMGTCEDAQGKKNPCCYNADYISGLVKGCTGICQSKDDWAHTVFEGDKYYKQQSCSCCTPIKQDIQMTLTCPYYYYKKIKRTFSVQTGCKCQPCPVVNPYEPFKAMTSPPVTNCAAHGGMVFEIGSVVLRKVNYYYGQCYEDRCELDDKGVGVIRRYSISCEIGDKCVPAHYNDMYSTVRKFVYKPNATMTCHNDYPVTQLIRDCYGTCLSYTSTNYGGEYQTDNMHHDSKINKNCKCCKAITGFIKVKLTCYIPNSDVTSEKEMDFNVPLGCKCERCNQTSLNYGSYGGGYGGNYYPQTPEKPYQPAMGRNPYKPPAMGNPYQQRGGNPYQQQRGGNPYQQQRGNPYQQQSGNPYQQQRGNPYHQQRSNPYQQQRGGNPYQPPTRGCSIPAGYVEMTRGVVPVDVDTLFQMLFTKENGWVSRWLQKTQYAFDIIYGNWETNPATGLKTRQITGKVNIPKNPITDVTSTTANQEQSVVRENVGVVYSVNSEYNLPNIIYGDSFKIMMNICIHEHGPHQSNLRFSKKTVITKPSSIPVLAQNVLKNAINAAAKVIYGNMKQELQNGDVASTYVYNPHG